MKFEIAETDHWETTKEEEVEVKEVEEEKEGEKWRRRRIKRRRRGRGRREEKAEEDPYGGGGCKGKRKMRNEGPRTGGPEAAENAAVKVLPPIPLFPNPPPVAQTPAGGLSGSGDTI